MDTLDEVMVRYGPDEIRAFAAHIATIENATERVAYAQRQFGRSGNDVLAIVVTSKMDTHERGLSAV